MNNTTANTVESCRALFNEPEGTIIKAKYNDLGFRLNAASQSQSPDCLTHGNLCHKLRCQRAWSHRNR